jgi:hypothetical protein
VERAQWQVGKQPTAHPGVAENENRAELIAGMSDRVVAPVSQGAIRDSSTLPTEFIAQSRPKRARFFRSRQLSSRGDLARTGHFQYLSRLQSTTVEARSLSLRAKDHPGRKTP